jgi:hypothetical protein
MNALCLPSFSSRILDLGYISSACCLGLLGVKVGTILWIGQEQCFRVGFTAVISLAAWNNPRISFSSKIQYFSKNCQFPVIFLEQNLVPLPYPYPHLKRSGILSQSVQFIQSF